MKTVKYYKQVIIRSEADLPKESGYYFVCLKVDKPSIIGINTCGYETKIDDQMWLSSIDWYLFPVPDVRKPELCSICKKTYLADRVCLTCTRELCSSISLPDAGDALETIERVKKIPNINWVWIRDDIRKLINKYKPTPYGELGLTDEIVEYLESKINPHLKERLSSDVRDTPIQRIKDKGLLLPGCAMDNVNAICDKAELQIRDEIIAKQDELIKRFIKNNLQIHSSGNWSEYQKLRDELAILKAGKEKGSISEEAMFKIEASDTEPHC